MNLHRPRGVNPQDIHYNGGLLGWLDIRRVKKAIQKLDTVHLHLSAQFGQKFSKKTYLLGQSHASIVRTTNQRLFVLYNGFGRLLGQGGFGKVMIAQDMDSKQWAAVKVMSLSKHPTNTAIYDSELAIMEQLNLIRGRAKLTSRSGHNKRGHDKSKFDKFYIFMDIQAGSNLLDTLNRDKLLDFDQRLLIAQSACQALANLHQQGIAHRDLKPENMFFDKKTGQVSLIDYGIATPIGAVAQGHLLAGTPGYYPPEDSGMAFTGTHRDVYALGVILGEIFVESFKASRSEDGRYAAAKRHDIHHEMPSLLDAQRGMMLARLTDELKASQSALKAEKAHIIDLYDRMTRPHSFERLSLDKLHSELDKLTTFRQARALLNQCVASIHKSRLTKQQQKMFDDLKFQIAIVDNVPTLAIKISRFNDLAQYSNVWLKKLPHENRLLACLNRLIDLVNKLFKQPTRQIANINNQSSSFAYQAFERLSKIDHTIDSTLQTPAPRNSRPQ